MPRSTVLGAVSVAVAAMLCQPAAQAAVRSEVLIRADTSDYSESVFFDKHVSLTTDSVASAFSVNDPDAVFNGTWSGQLFAFADADDRVVRASASNQLDVLTHINIANATATWSGTGTADFIGTGFADVSLLSEGRLGLSPGTYPPTPDIGALPYNVEALARTRLLVTDTLTNNSWELLAEFYMNRVPAVVPGTVTVTNYFENSIFNIFQFTRVDGVLTNTELLDSGALAPVAGVSEFSRTLAFSVPFVGGRDYSLQLESSCFTAASSAGEGIIITSPVGAVCNMANSSYLLGLSNFRDGDGNAIAPFALTDSAGTNLALPSPFVPGGTTPIPEPATWALLITGFGLVGAAARRRAAIA